MAEKVHHHLDIVPRFLASPLNTLHHPPLPHRSSVFWLGHSRIFRSIPGRVEFFSRQCEEKSLSK